MAPPPFFLPGKELPILWEDRHFIVVDKPAGLAVHPGPQIHDSVETRLTPQKRGGPWLAHRLDTDTSGCLLIARRKTALIAAQKAFAERLTTKRYWALVSGRPDKPYGEIHTMLRRISSPTEGWKMLSTPLEASTTASHPTYTSSSHTGGKRIRSSKDEAGQPAHTTWRLLASNGHISLLELTLHTGRTHQARLHCAHLGTPIIGDRLYSDVNAPHTAHTLVDIPAGLCLLARTLIVPITSAEATPYNIQATAHSTPMEAFLRTYGVI